MLICDSVSCTRNGKKIFNHLGFCLKEEGVLLLKGRNGAGKSSLLQILAGQLKPDSGQVLWQGQTILKNRNFEREMMFLSHTQTVNSRASVEQSLKTRAKKHDTLMLVPAALKFYNLEEYKDTPMRFLSTGWQRRALLAQLIVAPCKLWLLDEPTDFLDEEAVHLTASLMEARVQQGGLVIAASHSLKSGVEGHVLDVEDFRPSPALGF